MEQREFNNLVTELDKERLALMLSKSHDYATQDALSNFKRMNQLCLILGINPKNSSVDVALFYALLKIDRWCNLKNQNKTPSNESIKDTVIDLHNYIDLAYGCYVEENIDYGGNIG